MNLLQFYEALLMTAGMSVSKDGNVNIILANRKDPMTIGGKRLVIPTEEQLKTPDFSNRVVFHPMAENILAGESQAFAKFRSAMVRRINLVVGTQLNQLMLLAASPAEHKKLTPDQSAYLVALKDADEKCVQTLKKILLQIPYDDNNNSLVSIYIKRNGMYQGHKTPRVAIVTFPFYKKLIEAENSRELYGVKLRVRDWECIKALLEYIIPQIADPKEEYNAGSDSKIAPYTIAFMMAVNRIITVLNETTDLYFSEDEEVYSQLHFRNDWLSLIEDPGPLTKQIRLIPNQDSLEEESANPNNGLQNFTVPNVPQQTTQPVMQPQQQMGYQPQPVYQQPMYQQPVQPTQPVQSGGTDTFRDYMAKATGQQMYQQPVQQQPMYYQQQQPMYQQPVMMQQNGWGQFQTVPQQQQYTPNGWPTSSFQAGAVPVMNTMQPGAVLSDGRVFVGMGTHGYPVYK